MQATLERPLVMSAIAMEAGVLANMVSSVSDYFPSLFEGLAPAFGLVDKTNSDLKIKLQDRTENKVSDALEKLGYADHTRIMKIEVPEGFQGNTVAYLNHLIVSLDYFKNVGYPALEDYYVLLASILTNKEAKKSMKDHTKTFSQMEKSRENLSHETTTYFKAKSNEAMSLLGKHFKTNEEVREAFLAAETVERQLRALNLDSVKDMTQRIADTMGILIEQSKEGKISYLTPEVVKSLSYGGYEIAKQVEFVSVNIYRAISMLKSLEGTTERLQRLV